MFVCRNAPQEGRQQHVGFLQAHMHRLRGCAGMLAKKARLLVTNQLQYTHEATAVVYLEDGRVAASGPYDRVVGNERFADMLREYEVRIWLDPACLSTAAGLGLPAARGRA